VGAAALNVQLFLAMGWNDVVLYSIIAIAVLAGLCGALSRREKCRIDREAQAKGVPS